MTVRKMFRDELDPGACPECGNISIDGSSFDFEGTDVRQELTCADCGAEWFDTFTLSSRTVDTCVEPYVIEFY